MLHARAVRNTGYEPNCMILITLLSCRHIAGNGSLLMIRACFSGMTDQMMKQPCCSELS